MQRRAAIFVIALIPGVLTAYFSFQSGGYFAGAPALVAAELLVLIALWLALARRPLDGAGRGVLLAAAALGAFAVWILLQARGLTRPLARYRSTPGRSGISRRSSSSGCFRSQRSRVRLMAYGVAAAIVVVCAAAFLSRTVPDAVSGIGELQSGRLSYPLDYWNSLGLLAGLGIVLCGHFACASRDHWASRVPGRRGNPPAHGHAVLHLFARSDLGNPRRRRLATPVSRARAGCSRAPSRRFRRRWWRS